MAKSDSNSGKNTYYNEYKNGEYYIDDVYFSQNESKFQEKGKTGNKKIHSNKSGDNAIDKLNSSSPGDGKPKANHNQAAIENPPKSSTRVLGAYDILYEHESRDRLHESMHIDNTIKASRIKALSTRKIFFISVISITILMIVILCAILGLPHNSKGACVHRYIKTINAFRNEEDMIEIPKQIESTIQTLNDCQEICNIMDGCKSLEYLKRNHSKCLLYRSYVDEPEIIDDKKDGAISFNRCVEGFSLSAQNSGCGHGSSELMKDYGNKISLEGCKIKCVRLNNCSDITWHPESGRCITFNGCEHQTTKSGFHHYFYYFPKGKIVA